MPGTMGSIAKAMCRTYNNLKEEFPNKNSKELLALTLEGRLLAWKMTRQPLPEKEMIDIWMEGIEKSPSLALLTQQVVNWERPELVEVDREAYEDIKELIDEIVRENAPREVW